MNSSTVLKKIRKRARKFKRYGYDMPGSRRFLLQVSGIRGGKILEVGTGKGHLALQVARRGLRITSVDCSSEQLGIARRYLEAFRCSRYVTLKKMNAQRLRFPSRSFDAVISIDFFHHAAAPLQCLKEIMRVARKTLVIADLNRRGFRIMDRIHRSEGNSHPEPRIGLSRLKKHLLKSGYDVKSYRKSCHLYLVARRKAAG